MDTNTIFALILSVLIAAGLSFLYYIFKAKNKSNLNLFLAFLRFLSFISLFILLINPIITRDSFEIEKTPLVVVMDNSRSIPFFKSENEARECYQKIITNSRLQEKFNIQTYQFDTDFRQSKIFNFKGKQTDLNAVAEGLKSSYKNKFFPTILLTDGNQTKGNEYEYSFDKRNKIYPVVLGDTTQVFDLKISQINANKYAFYKNKFPVEVFVHYSGNKKVNANFSIRQGKVTIAKQNLSFSSTKKTAVINIILPANSIGLQLYQATVSSSEKEKNQFNNNKKFVTEIIDQKSDIALISSINHPDVGALKRAIETNAQRKVTSLKLSDINELKKYNVIIFYQPNSSFKQAFDVSKIAGINTFTITGVSTDYDFLNHQQNDLIFKMANQTEDYFAGFNAQFNLFAIDNIGFEYFPPLKNSFGTTAISGNVSVLLTSKIRGIDAKSPLLALAENNGKRTAYLLGENSWKWRSQNFIDNQSFDKFDLFIDKIMQYLVSNTSRKSLEVEHELYYDSGDNIEIKANYFNKNLEFDEKARLSISIQNTLTKVVTNYDLLKGSNSYKVNLDGLPVGKYNFTVTELNSKKRYTSHFEILNFDIEKQFVNPDFEKLNQLASQTKGNVYLPNQVDDLINELLNNTEYKTLQIKQSKKTPLIDWIWLLVFISTVLTTEWFVRKYNGLL
jgi:hypothetical protein